jgi:hypothetical protein
MNIKSTEKNNTYINNPEESVLKQINEPENEVNNTQLSLNKAYQLGLMKNPNNDFLTIPDKAYNVKYTSSNYLANPSNYIYVDDPIDIIGNCENAIINQPTTYLQMATGCITENEYDVFLDTPQGLVYAFYFKEESNCFCRNCCKQAKRPFIMYANYVPSGKEIMHKIERHYFDIERHCGCNHYLCFCNFIRPKMKISYSKNGKKLGTIIDSCDSTKKKLEIYDENEQLIYTIETSCCQIGLCFGRQPETVAKINFRIFDHSGRILGYIIKIPSISDKLAQIQVDSYSGFHDAANNFIINFPIDAPPEHKFLLIIAAIKSGYQFFTENRNDCFSSYNRSCFCFCGYWCNYFCCPFRFLQNSICPPCFSFC